MATRLPPVFGRDLDFRLDAERRFLTRLAPQLYQLGGPPNITLSLYMVSERLYDWRLTDENTMIYSQLLNVLNSRTEEGRCFPLACQWPDITELGWAVISILPQRELSARV